LNPLLRPDERRAGTCHLGIVVVRHETAPRASGEVDDELGVVAANGIDDLVVHLRRKGTDGGEGAAPSDREDVIDALIGESVQVGRRNGSGEAGRVDEDGCPAGSLLHKVGRFGQAGAVRHRRGDGKVLVAWQARQELVALMVRLTLQEDHLRAQRRQAPCCRRTDGAVAAGDDGDLAIEAFARFESSGDHGLALDQGRGQWGIRGAPGSSLSSTSSR
jgi:hypothetical protein